MSVLQLVSDTVKFEILRIHYFLSMYLPQNFYPTTIPIHFTNNY